MFCNHVERVPDIQFFLTSKVANDPALRNRVENASKRAAQYRQHVDQLRAGATVSVKSFEELADEASKFVDAFMKSRPPGAIISSGEDRRKDPRTPGGRSGREEWT